MPSLSPLLCHSLLHLPKVAKIFQSKLFSCFSPSSCWMSSCPKYWINPFSKSRVEWWDKRTLGSWFPELIDLFSFLLSLSFLNLTCTETAVFVSVCYPAKAKFRSKFLSGAGSIACQVPRFHPQHGKQKQRPCLITQEGQDSCWGCSLPQYGRWKIRSLEPRM